MKSQKTLGIQFVTRPTKSNSSLLQLFLRLTVNGRRVEFSLKRPIPKKLWNPVKGSAKGSSEESSQLNESLDRIRAFVSSKYHELLVKGIPFTAEDLKAAVLGIEEEAYSLRELIEYHQEVMSDTLKPGTLKNYETSKKYLLTYLEKSLKKKDISFQMVDYKFIMGFESFLRRHKPTNHQRPLQHNGILKHMERFKKILNLAVKMDLLEKNPFDKYQFKYKRFDRDYLEDEELERLEEKVFSNQRLNLVRDLFVFSCYTGLAYIDVSTLSRQSLVKSQGEYWINTERTKTNTPIKIPVLPKAMELINKYKDHPRAVSNDLLLPVLSNQKLNSYLKEIADLCEIDKNLSFHVARHTFATTVTLKNGVPMETVSKLLGHNKISTTQIYARVVEVKVKEDMGKLKERLSMKGKKM
ncbi:site-specific integrase [Algoriphagus formosus]|uniref:Site-specific integrase n=1 Tax=Algoriphagus formosus TaxID=2007308 RepID=A0A4R5V7K7_9BACT|nr:MULTISPECIES: site-specific integrase [Algoriphagus]TDK47989.1 site-specific integrase [Algoriphagus aquimaris]